VQHRDVLSLMMEILTFDAAIVQGEENTAFEGAADVITTSKSATRRLLDCHSGCGPI